MRGGNLMERVNVSMHLAELAENFITRALVETDGAEYITLAYIKKDDENYFTVKAVDGNEIVAEASRRYKI